ncbi:hypothetical protein H2200_001462 [Cladophialophora chaetospira]|uniref:Histone H1 n=1 Tax=Cladophialophora chaetospira TaxID=386627 RepID=A0AA38XKX1_9EURO|nr:hypothetical protein H2200_001462 [Cladophialophora chaetospira]
MPPKKVTGAAAQAKEAKEKKPAAAPAHGKYKDMIKEAILNLKERNGSSRQAIKKYVKANNNITVNSEAQFDSLFNRALKGGVDNGDFVQPKGPSGPVKLAKKEAAKPAEKKPAAKKEKAAKEETKDKPKATKAKPATKPKTAATKAKKATTPKKAAAAKPKANTATKRAPKAKAKAEPPAPAVTDVPTVLKKTKSGRVSKQKTTTGTTKAAPKKAAATKATPKKSATPKKAEAAA